MSSAGTSPAAGRWIRLDRPEGSCSSRWVGCCSPASRSPDPPPSVPCPQPPTASAAGRVTVWTDRDEPYRRGEAARVYLSVDRAHATWPCSGWTPTAGSGCCSPGSRGATTYVPDDREFEVTGESRRPLLPGGRRPRGRLPLRRSRRPTRSTSRTSPAATTGTTGSSTAAGCRATPTWRSPTWPPGSPPAATTTTTSLPYYVERHYDYPRFVCYDCHAYASYRRWNPYGQACSRYRVVVRDDPRYYPYRYGQGRNVVADRPRHPGPRYIFREADPREAASARDQVRRGEDAGGRRRRRRRACPRSGGGIASPRSSRPPGPAAERGAAPGRAPARAGARPRGPGGRGAQGAAPGRLRAPPGAPRPARDAATEHRRARAAPPPSVARPDPAYNPGMRPLLMLSLLAVAAPLRAQTSAASARAAATITQADVAHRIGVIADDSMMGRDTPSRGLDLTARYVADQFRRFGLKPGGDDGTWFQRYPITRRQLDQAGSRVVLSAGGVEAIATLDRAARYVQGTVGGSPVRGPVVLVGGRLTPEAVSRMAVRDKLVLYVPDATGAPPETATRVGRALRLAGPRAVVLVSDLPAERFAARIPRRANARTTVDLKIASPPFIELSEHAVGAVLRAARLDLAATRADTAPVFRALPELGLRVELRDSVLRRLTAPNTVGILEGSDPVLKQEYLVFSAHMDHIGITPGQPDSINNGADDDGSGTVGVVELAEAFSQPGRAPEALDHLPHRERRGEGALGQPLLQRASAGARRTDRGRPQHRHDRTELARHDRGDRQGALGPRHHARAGERGAPRAGHDGDRRPLARGAVLLPLGPLQLRPQGRADALLLQRRPPGLPPGHRLARQDRQREGGADSPAAVLPGPGDRRRGGPPQVESRELPRDRGRAGRAIA